METKNLKPFDLEKAKAGAKVMTRGGQKVEILKLDRKNIASIVGLVGSAETIFTWDIYGNWMNAANCKHNDLVMAPEIKEGWVNVYRRLSDDNLFTSCIYKSNDIAKEMVSNDNKYLTTTKITWEE